MTHTIELLEFPRTDGKIILLEELILWIQRDRIFVFMF